MQFRLIMATMVLMSTISIFAEAIVPSVQPEFVNAFAPVEPDDGDEGPWIPEWPKDGIRPSVHYERYGTICCFPNHGQLNEEAHNATVKRLMDWTEQHKGVGIGSMFASPGVYTYVCSRKNTRAFISLENLKYMLRTIEYWCGSRVTSFFTISDYVPELEGLTVGKSNTVWLGCQKPTAPGQWLPNQMLLDPTLQKSTSGMVETSTDESVSMEPSTSAGGGLAHGQGAE